MNASKIATSQRVRNAKKLGIHPRTDGPAEEGEHYTVLSYSDWGDVFVPTTVQWSDGTVDDLTDLDRSRRNMETSIDQEHTRVRA